MYPGRVNFHQLATETESATHNELRKLFAPQVILVNHEKSLAVDTTCSNLATKFNLVYISLYQLIKQHFETQSEWSKRLKGTMVTKDIRLEYAGNDEFEEQDYSAVHFDLELVVQLL